jgi:hypothetical protein
MGTKWMLVGMTAALMGAGAVTMVMPSADAAPVTPSASPIGRLVEVQLVAWPLSTGTVGRVTGTLIAMPAGGLVVQDGRFEHWLPLEQVMPMKVSR